MATDTTVRPLSEARVNTILNDILDWEIETRNSTPSERAMNTTRIARRRRVNKMQVAAVRANLTRGAYGSKANLLRTRRRELRAAQG